MAGPAVLFQAGDHASRPANGSGCVLYSCTDHDLVYVDDGSAWSTFMTLVGGSGGAVATDAIWDAAGDLAVGSGSDTAAKLTKGANGTVLSVVAGSVGWAAPAAPVFTTVDAQRTTDVAVSAATYTVVTSVSLTAGTWDIWAILGAKGPTTANAQYVTYAQLYNSTDAAQVAQEAFGRVNAAAVTADPYTPIAVNEAGLVLAGTKTIQLRMYCDVAATAVGSTSLGTGGGSKIHAMKIA